MFVYSLLFVEISWSDSSAHNLSRRVPEAWRWSWPHASRCYYFRWRFIHCRTGCVQ